MLVVVFFGILAGASFDEDGNLEAWVWLIIIAALVIFLVSLYDITPNRVAHK